MTPGDRLRRALLRWRHAGLAGLLLAPFAVASLLGFLWLHERGWLIGFAAGCAAIGVALWTGRRLLSHLAARGGAAEPATALPPPEADPDWNAAEAAAFATVRAAIHDRLTAPLPWQDMWPEALRVVEETAAALSDGRRGMLDFTLPEALLLIDRVALRYRAFLHRNVPFADQLSLRTGWWLWQRRRIAGRAARGGWLAWRGLRLAINPPVAVLREVERAATAGLQDRLTDAVMRDAQAILLEEVAHAAVELYSGRLRFSEAELLETALPADAADRASGPVADAPVRIVLGGQLSAGKTTLVNALIGGLPAGETDVAPSTDGPAVHRVEIDGVACHLVDLPGLDGSAEGAETVLREAQQADAVLWVIRADRPGREPDRAALRALNDWFTARPERRPPPVVVAVNAADRLLPGWPWPEHRMPEAEVDRLGAAMAAIGADLDGRVPVPLSAIEPAWNLAALTDALAEVLPEALMVQRNRRRLAAGAAAGGLRLVDNLGRAGRGLRSGVGALGGRLWDRSAPAGLRRMLGGAKAPEPTAPPAPDGDAPDRR